MSKPNKVTVFLCNIDYVIDKYVEELKLRNEQYHFDIIYSNDDKDESILKSSLMVGTFFSSKKFIILKGYNKLSKETINLIKTTENRVFIIIKEKSPFYKLLSKDRSFDVKDSMYTDNTKLKELVNQLSTLFNSYDESITSYLVKLFEKQPNKLIQQLIMLSSWKTNLTKKDVLNFYKMFDNKEVYELVELIANGQCKKLYTAINNVKEDAKILHLFHYLAIIVKDLGKMRLYEKNGYVASALPINWGTKNIYKNLKNKEVIHDLSRLINEIEKDQKFYGNKLDKGILQDKLIFIMKRRKEIAS